MRGKRPASELGSAPPPRSGSSTLVAIGQWQLTDEYIRSVPGLDRLLHGPQVPRTGMSLETLLLGLVERFNRREQITIAWRDQANSLEDIDRRWADANAATQASHARALAEVRSSLDQANEGGTKVSTAYDNLRTKLPANFAVNLADATADRPYIPTAAEVVHGASVRAALAERPGVSQVPRSAPVVGTEATVAGYDSGGPPPVEMPDDVALPSGPPAAE